MKLNQSALILFFVIVYSLNALSCTTFVVGKGSENLYYARSYDRGMRDALVMTNLRGVYKRAQVFGNPMKWQSKYGSITFNQYGRDFPLGGMNEQGLVIEVMILPEAKDFHTDKSLPEVNPAQWVQYQLDVSASVDEVIANARKITVTDMWVPLHYLVSDGNKIAVIEYNKDSLFVYGGGIFDYNSNDLNFPVAALTNNSYKELCDTLFTYSDFGGNGGPLPVDPVYELSSDEKGTDTGFSIARFLRAVGQVRKFYNDVSIENITTDSIYNALDCVANPKSTVFQVVYDLKNKSVSWRNIYTVDVTGVTGDMVHASISLESFNFNTDQTALISNMQDPENPVLASKLKDVPYNEFIPYKESYNKTLVDEANKKEIMLQDQAHDFLSDFLPAVLYDSESDEWWGDQFLEPLWYKYPEKYTSTSQAVSDEEILNFYLEMLLHPLSKSLSSMNINGAIDPYRKVLSGTLGTTQQIKNAQKLIYSVYLEDVKNIQIKKLAINDDKFNISVSFDFSCKVNAKHLAWNCECFGEDESYLNWMFYKWCLISKASENFTIKSVQLNSSGTFVSNGDGFKTCIESPEIKHGSLVIDDVELEMSGLVPLELDYRKMLKNAVTDKIVGSLNKSDVKKTIIKKVQSLLDKQFDSICI